VQEGGGALEFVQNLAQRSRRLRGTGEAAGGPLAEIPSILREMPGVVGRGVAGAASAVGKGLETARLRTAGALLGRKKLPEVPDRDPREAYLTAAPEDPKDLSRFLREAIATPSGRTRFIPFVGAVPGLAQNLTIKAAADRLAKNDYSEWQTDLARQDARNRDLKLVEEFRDQEMDKAIQKARDRIVTPKFKASVRKIAEKGDWRD
jgi:hypothetical protein